MRQAARWILALFLASTAGAQQAPPQPAAPAAFAATAPARLCFFLSAAQDVKNWHGAWWAGKKRKEKPDRVRWDVSLDGLSWSEVGQVVLESERATSAGHGVCLPVPAGTARLWIRCSHSSWRRRGEGRQVNDRIWASDDELVQSEAASPAAALERQFSAGEAVTIDLSCVVEKTGRRYAEMALAAAAGAKAR